MAKKYDKYHVEVSVSKFGYLTSTGKMFDEFYEAENDIDGIPGAWLKTGIPLRYQVSTIIGDGTFVYDSNISEFDNVSSAVQSGKTRAQTLGVPIKFGYGVAAK